MARAARRAGTAGPGFVPQALWSSGARRQRAAQALVLVAVLLASGWLLSNLVQNLDLLGAEVGYGFLVQAAGYDINQTLIPYDASDAHWRAALVGLINTGLVSLCGIALATVIGFAVGVLRLSPNWPVKRLMAAYIEFTRNVPVLLHILLWHGLIINTLPHPRRASEPLANVFLTNRGIYVPEPVAQPGLWGVGVALAVALAVLALYRHRARHRGPRHRRRLRWPVLALLLVLPAGVFLATGRPLSWSLPELGGFNFRGGMVLRPEFMALWLGLSLYSAAFIAENVRAGIQSVDHGQLDAARALGLRGGLVMRLVVIPQALRVIVPPLISQYLNLVKNSSLAIAVGYMDLVATLGGITLNQTGRALECMSIVLVVYLLISLAVSALMNRFNRRTALVEH